MFFAVVIGHMFDSPLILHRAQSRSYSLTDKNNPGTAFEKPYHLPFGNISTARDNTFFIRDIKTYRIKFHLFRPLNKVKETVIMKTMKVQVA
jgi:hypothetical protein